MIHKTFRTYPSVPPNNQDNNNNADMFSGSKKAATSVCLGFFGVMVLISIILISISLKKLKSTEYGVQYNKVTKILDDAAKTGGLHPGPPGYSFIKFPSTQISADHDDTCVSRDGLRVAFSVTYQYQIPEEQIVDAIIKYRDFKKWVVVVEAAGNSAIQHTCSMFSITNFQNKRGLIQSTMMDNLKLKLEGSDGDDTNITSIITNGVHARAVSLQLKNLGLPEEYRTAVSEKQSAEEDIALAKNQRLQLTTRAQTELKSAQESALKIRDTALNTANVTITEAQLRAEETRFALAREAKVLTQVKEDFQLTTEGVLAYMTNQLYRQIPKLRVSTGEPAKISLKDEL